MAGRYGIDEKEAWTVVMAIEAANAARDGEHDPIADDLVERLKQAFPGIAKRLHAMDRFWTSWAEAANDPRVKPVQEKADKALQAMNAVGCHGDARRLLADAFNAALHERDELLKEIQHEILMKEGLA